MKNASRHIVLLLAVLALAALIRFRGLADFGPTPGDDAGYLNQVKTEYASLRPLLSRLPPRYDTLAPVLVANKLTQRTYRARAFTSMAKPLFILKLAAIEGFWGLDLYRFHLSLAAVGLLSVLVVYLIGRRIFNPAAGLIAAFLLALSPWAVRYSTYGVPTVHSAFWLLLAFLAIVSRRFRPCLAGVLVSVAVMFNPTVAGPAFLLGALAAARWWRESAAGGGLSRGKLFRGWGCLAAGAAAVPLLWEAGNYWYSVVGKIPYRTFWAALGETSRDNLLHALNHPIDPIFWLRVLNVTETPLLLLLWLAGMAWLIVFSRRLPRARRFGPLSLLAVTAGVIVVSTWSGITQCARHYFFAWPIGLVAIGGMLSSWWERGRRGAESGGEGGGKPSRVWFAPVLIVLVLAGAAAAASFRLATYRRSRLGDLQLRRWLAEEEPGTVVTFANQPPTMWPELERFHNWDNLARLEVTSPPSFVAYGDYLGITRVIRDYPGPLFPVAQACRKTEREVFRVGTHLSDPAFLYENEDYYWGFVRQRKEPFDPDLRVIPVSALLEFRDRLDLPEDAIVKAWRHPQIGLTHNVYWPFVNISVHSYRSPWPAFWLAAAFAALAIFFSRPNPLPLREIWARHKIVFILAGVLAVAFYFRAYGLSRFTQMGGDDVEYRVYVQRGSSFPAVLDKGAAAPIYLTALLTRMDVNVTITSFAKPLFVLERVLLHYLVGTTIQSIHYLTLFHGLLAVALVFLVGRRFGGNAVGLISAGLWAVSPWAMTYSTWGIHLSGGLVLLCLALLFYFRHLDSGSRTGIFLAGLFLSAGAIYSSSNLWPVACLIFIDLVFRLWRLAIGPDRSAVFGRGGLFAVGLILPFIAWEGVSLLAAAGLQQEWIPYPVLLHSTIRDNLGHAAALPIDPLFFWRHLLVSEGWLVGAGLTAAFLYALYLTVRRRAPRKVVILTAWFFSVAVAMNFTGGAQVIRHFFPAWLPLTLLGGWLAARLLRRLPFPPVRLLPLTLLILVPGWRRAQLFRLARWAPDRVSQWADNNYVEDRTATLRSQNLELWPGLQPIGSWRELENLARQVPPGVMMYSDYIELAHGSWIYARPEYFEIAETARRMPDELFRTPSYLRYRPALFENEFYYWGLFRNDPEFFDPDIRVLALSPLLRTWREIEADPEALEEFRAPTRREPPALVPARRDQIYRPFMEPPSVPGSYRIHLAASLFAFLLLSLLQREGQSVHICKNEDGEPSEM